MSAIAAAPVISPVENKREVSWLRLLWVAPLTVIASLIVCFGLKWVAQTLDPNLGRMPMLGSPMPTLALEGAIAAVIVFALFALLIPRPLFWFRIVGVIALVLSWIPDISLGVGGGAMRTAMGGVSVLTRLGEVAGGAPRGAGPPPGGPPPGAGSPPAFGAGLPIEQVLVLMLLHAAVAIVCIGLLTTLTRRQARSA